MSEARNPFDRADVAEAYDDWYETEVGAVADRLERRLIFKLAAPEPGERCLEVGAGTGHITRYLAERGLSVVALDGSRAMLKVAREALDDHRVDWQLGHAQALPYDDESFDLCLSVTTLEFVDDPGQMLSEMYRVLAPGGRMVVATINRQSSWGRTYRRQAKQQDTPFRQARFLSADELVQSLQPFGPVRWNSAVFFPPSGRWISLAPVLERVGRIFCKGSGALLVARVDK